MTDLLYKDEVYAIVGAADEGQLINYLKATGLKVRVLINFGHYPSREWTRLVFTKELLSKTLKPQQLSEDSTDYQTQSSED
jgi:hypothetical protein